MVPSSFAAIPPGALDLTGEAVRRRRALQRAAMGVLEHAGYEEMIPPTFEYEDTFLRAAGPGVAERLVRFPDRDGRIHRVAAGGENLPPDFARLVLGGGDHAALAPGLGRRRGNAGRNRRRHRGKGDE